MFFVYVIVSKIKRLRFYVGMTERPEVRLKEHNSSKTKSTKRYVPWELFFTEKYQSRKEARARELYYKSGSGKEKIKQKWSHSSAGYLPAVARAGASAGREHQLKVCSLYML